MLFGIQNKVKIFDDRSDAATQLVKKLEFLRGKDVVVFALPRGGVELGAIIAKSLQTPIDLVVTRKIGHPNSPEYAICALTDFGELVCDENERESINDEIFNKLVAKEKAEAKRRKNLYLKGVKRVDPKGKIAVIVDDGVATGLTIRAAILSVKKMGAQRIVVAVPVISDDVAKVLEENTEVVTILREKYYLGAVGAYYKNFPQVSDEEVIEFLRF
jgi:putative phosphoribosyl transferase